MGGGGKSCEFEMRIQTFRKVGFGYQIVVAKFMGRIGNYRLGESILLTG